MVHLKTGLLVSFLLSAILSAAQENPAREFSLGITPEELTEHVRILASEEYGGRATGSDGQKKAAFYIMSHFSQMKISGPTDNHNPYFQEYELVKNGWDKFMLIKGPDTLHFEEEIHVTGYWPESKNNINVVFVGYGADTENYSDYQGIDVAGKVVAFLNGEPMDKNGRFLTTKTYLPEYSMLGYDKARIAAEKGALGSIMIDPDRGKIDKLIQMNKRFSANQQFFLPGSGSVSNNPKGLIALDYESASILFGNNPADWDDYIKKISKGKSSRELLETQVKLISDRGENKIVSENVIGVLRGSQLPEEYIVITAHYDHLGRRGGEVFYGADDNASGTAALIEIAEAFAEAADAGYRPKRSVLFVAVSGEEIGLLGSRYYTTSPVAPLVNTVAALNMDMIGRQDDEELKDSTYVYLYLSDSTGSGLDSLARESSLLAGNNIMVNYKYGGNNELSTGGSDHVSFENAGIPVLYYYCGTHDDYHRPSDTWDKLDYESMAVISKMVFSAAWLLANDD